MTALIGQLETISVLTSSKLPDGTDNPFNDQIDLLQHISGEWELITRDEATRMVSKANGLTLPAGDIYQSPKFSSQNVSLSDITQAISLCQTLEVYLDVFDYPAFVEVNPEQYSQAVPNYLPKFEVQQYDDDGQPDGTVPTSWENWRDSTHHHLFANGVHCVPLNSNTNAVDVAGSVIKQLIDDGFRVKAMDEFPAGT